MATENKSSDDSANSEDAKKLHSDQLVASSPASPSRMDAPPPPIALAVLVRGLRVLSGLLLLFGWPSMTFLLPFAFDSNTPENRFAAFLFLALWLTYPVIWFGSGLFYKASLRVGYQREALVVASAPLVLVIVFGLAFVALRHLY
jgi:hypothetical protein